MNIYQLNRITCLNLFNTSRKNYSTLKHDNIKSKNMEARKNLGEFIQTIHNPECVVEVYFDKAKNEINEVKSLNYNRVKIYNYSLSEYKDNIERYSIHLQN